MLDIQSLFLNRAPKESALKQFGFTLQDGVYRYDVPVLNGQFLLRLALLPTGEVSTKMIDVAFNEEYVLHLVAEATGEFVGRVREEYEQILNDLAQKCFTGGGIFKSQTAKTAVEYVREHYGEDLEFLWADTPENAIVRRKDNGKWYAVFVMISKRKLGDFEDIKIPVLNVKVNADEIENLVDGTTCFHGWHMNKKSWISIPLDGGMPADTVMHRIDVSRNLVKKK